MTRQYKRWKKRDPAKKSKNGGEGRRIVKYIKREDYGEMSRLALVHRDENQPDSEAYYRSYRDYVLMLLGVNCGSRIETILEWMPSDLAGGQMTATESKTGKRVQFELNAGVYSEVKKFIDFYKIGPHEFIFRKTRSSKDAITRKTAWLRIKALAREAGIEYSVGAHSLRKSYARWLYDDGMDIHKVSRLLQHSSEETTRTYIGLTDTEVDKIRTKICNMPVSTGDGGKGK